MINKSEVKHTNKKKVKRKKQKLISPEKIVIEKNIPRSNLNSLKKNNRDKILIENEYRKIIATMEVKDSFFLEGHFTELSSMLSRLRTASKGLGYKIICRSVIEKDIIGVRIWRTK